MSRRGLCSRAQRKEVRIFVHKDVSESPTKFDWLSVYKLRGILLRNCMLKMAKNDSKMSAIPHGS